MSNETGQSVSNPKAFLAIGIAMMGSGISLMITLYAVGAELAMMSGLGLVSGGILFLILGARANQTAIAESKPDSAPDSEKDQ